MNELIAPQQPNKNPAKQPSPTNIKELAPLNSALGPVRQLGYVVDNLETTMEIYRQLGAGAWSVMKNVSLEATYHDQPTKPVIHVALGYIGDLQIELIQQVNQAASPYQRFIEQNRYGQHHTAYLVDDIDAVLPSLINADFNPIFDIQMPAGIGRYLYLTHPTLGDDHYIELLTATKLMKQMFAAGSAAAKTWPSSRGPSINAGLYLKVFGLIKKFLDKRAASKEG